MKKVFVALAMLGALLCFSACSNSSGGGSNGITWTFINESALETVRLTPQGSATPSAPFDIAPGMQAKVTWSGNSYNYSWNPVSKLDALADEDAKVCRFKDKNP